MAMRKHAAFVNEWYEGVCEDMRNFQLIFLGDSDDETDFTKMDMGNKKGPVGR